MAIIIRPPLKRPQGCMGLACSGGLQIRGPVRLEFDRLRFQRVSNLGFGHKDRKIHRVGFIDCWEESGLCVFCVLCG